MTSFCSDLHEEGKNIWLEWGGGHSDADMHKQERETHEKKTTREKPIFV
jgi:hypothetical protein